MDRPQPDLIYFDIGGVLVTHRPDPQQFASILNLGTEPHVLTLIDHLLLRTLGECTGLMSVPLTFLRS